MTSPSPSIARRQKDLIFTAELARRRMVVQERLLELLAVTPVDEKVRTRILADIAREFAPLANEE